MRGKCSLTYVYYTSVRGDVFSLYTAVSCIYVCSNLSSSHVETLPSGPVCILLCCGGCGSSAARGVQRLNREHSELIKAGAGIASSLSALQFLHIIQNKISVIHKCCSNPNTIRGVRIQSVQRACLPPHPHRGAATDVCCQLPTLRRWKAALALFGLFSFWLDMFFP